MGSYFEDRMAELREQTITGNPSIFHLVDKAKVKAPKPTLVGTKRGHIYFVMAQRHVKIGFATNVPSRVASLQTGNHLELSVQETFSSYVEAEKMIHERFAKDRVRGEWFNLTYEIEELWEDIWDYQGRNATNDGTAKSHLANMPKVFFELDVVADLLANV
jgi:hypothetical protein